MQLLSLVMNYRHQIVTIKTTETEDELMVKSMIKMVFPGQKGMKHC